MNTEIDDINDIDNTEFIARQIFSRPPGLKNSIQLQLEEQTIEQGQEDPENFIQEILSVITLHGIKILFGHVNFYTLSQSQINLIKQYSESYGYYLEINNNNGIYFRLI